MKRRSSAVGAARAARPAVSAVRRAGGTWAARLRVDGRTVPLTSDLDARQYDERVARETFDHVAKIVARKLASILRSATRELRGLYNDDWRGERAKKLTAQEFTQRLTVRSVHTSEPDNPSRLMTVYLSPGRLFSGHLVECMLEWNGVELGEPDLAG